MVEGEDDEAVMYVNSEEGFRSLRIVNHVDHLIYRKRYRHRRRTLITTFTTRFYYAYLLTILTCRLSLNVIPVYFLLVLHRCQWGYCSFEVQSCMFRIQFYITDISITSIYLVTLSTFFKASCWSGGEQDNTLVSENGRRISPIEWWFRGYVG